MRALILSIAVMLFAAPCQADLLAVSAPSRQELLDQEIKEIFDSIRVSHERRVAEWNTLYDRVWNNARFTPKEIIEGFGTRGVEVFSTSVKEEKHIQEIDPKWVLHEAPYRVTPNPDMSMSVGECIHESCMPKPEPVLEESADNIEPAI